MRKIVVTLTVITSVLIACSPKSSKSSATPQATAEAIKGSAKAGATIIKSEKCTKCHKDKSGYVPKHTFEEQEKVILGMAKRAKLSEQETADLIAFVKANAKKLIF